MTKTILILGASIDQLPVYLEARRRGLRVIGCDMRTDVPGVRHCDRFLAVSTRDTAAIVAAVGGERIDAVIGPASDASQLSVYALSREYDTPFQPSLRAVTASVDKGFFLGELARLGRPVHRFAQDRSLASLKEFATSVGGPVVVKPTDASGSKGITIVRDPSRLDAALAEAARFSHCGEIIVEEMIEGAHYSLEAFFKGGRLAFLGLSQKTLGGENGVITCAHLMPAPVPADLLAAVERETELVGKAIDLTDGPLNGDIVVTADGGVRFIEVGARLAGNGMARVVLAAYGVDLIGAALALAIGEEPDVTSTGGRVAMLRVLASEVEGEVVTVAGLETARAVPGVVDLEVQVAAGSRVRRFTESANKLGYILVIAADHGGVEQAARAALGNVRIEVRTTLPWAGTRVS